ncbi:hypothetical protein TPY_2925 [Sulfobacillus acidophilus TPY]|uniref:SCP-like extracellular n=1 Tax=Sulfobacillus acidophilus (strain ATCC 700253 / DSM 10332 / NAL) TaxID=679936 RepID=G8TST8_SULAD|nr:hypothetical protein TPY_2925 [Sulfobacillus acidophilus TPY]AEW04465.1 SCP-like extracellular [Sulfobacillus acidophilus DSM 10332]
MNYFTHLLLAAGLPVLGFNTAVTPPPLSVAPVTTPSPMISRYVWPETLAPQTPSTVSTPISAVTSPVLSPSEATTMILLINQARRQQGLLPYTINPTLMALAQKRAQMIAQTGDFTSDLPQYGWPVQMEQQAGISAESMGAENIAEAGNVQQAFFMLMASPPHQANILSPYMTQIGVGVAPLPNGVAISELFTGPNL